MVGGGEHHAARDLVALEPAVPIGPAVLGRDDVRRVARDQVEALARDGLEQAAEPHLDVRVPVQGRVQLGEGERARVDVGGDDLRGMTRGEESLHPAAGAHVEDTAAHAGRQAVAHP